MPGCIAEATDLPGDVRETDHPKAHNGARCEVGHQDERVRRRDQKELEALCAYRRVAVPEERGAGGARCRRYRRARPEDWKLSV